MIRKYFDSFAINMWLDYGMRLRIKMVINVLKMRILTDKIK